MLRIALLVVLVVLASLAWWRFSLRNTPALTSQTATTVYAKPLGRPGGPLRVYHLGHSLVGREIPAMLAQLAGEGHSYDSQLGWGTSLKEHWEPDLVINGFDAENDHPRFRPAREAIVSGDYDAVVLTEMVEIRDAIKYHNSPRYVAQWAELARSDTPETRVYLYETWHDLTDPDGWLNRLDQDLQVHWKDKLLYAGFDPKTETPIYLIPAGQVMAQFVRALDDAGGVAGLASREGLFRRDEVGEQDPIHVNDLGAYLVALTHYAVLYHRSPVGLPFALSRADGSPADAPSAEAAKLMQETVWTVVTRLPETGVAQ
jgi:hypothetical protein